MASKNEELSKERVNNAVKRLAQVINQNEVTIQELTWACESMDWNDEVVFQIKDAQMYLGQALATLVNWFDGDEKEEEK